MKNLIKLVAFIISFAMFVYCVWVHKGLWMLAADFVTACIWMPLLANFVGMFWREEDEEITIY